MPEPYNPQDWDRYAYVRNNPVRYNDPTGHWVDDGCGSEGCSLSQRGENANAQKEVLWLAENERLQCQAGNQAHCSASTAEIVGFVAVGLVSVGIAPELPLLIDTIGWQAAALCSQSPICWGLIGAAGSQSVQNGRTNSIGVTGDVGERFLKQAGGESQYFFSTTQGGRYIDQLVNGHAYEAKVGYVSLTQKISMQVSKDVELLLTNRVNSVSWVFFPSPVTGVGGPSKALYDLLTQNGISVYYVTP